MNMRMRHFQTHNSDSYTFTWNHFLYCFRNSLCKDMHLR